MWLGVEVSMQSREHGIVVNVLVDHFRITYAGRL